MSSYPVKKFGNNIGKNEPKILSERSDNPGSFISFRYSYKSMTSFGGKTHIASKQAKFENGKFETEEFEGVMDGDISVNLFKEIQKFFFRQLSSFNPLSFFLPSFRKNEEKK